MCMNIGIQFIFKELEEEGNKKQQPNNAYTNKQPKIKNHARHENERLK